MPDHPVINHIAWMGPDVKWHSRYFLPLYNDILRWAQGMNCPDACDLAYHCHPMVWDEHHAGHKLCTLTVIRAGLIKREELI